MCSLLRTHHHHVHSWRAWRPPHTQYRNIINTILTHTRFSPTPRQQPQHCCTSSNRTTTVRASVTGALMAVMGVKETDWDAVLQCQHLAPDKVITCFGVHPWNAHQHAAEELPGREPKGESPPGSPAEMFVLPNGHDPVILQTLTAQPLSTTWYKKLEQLLQAYPKAVVGECGLDRAAVIPGTKVSVSLDHQLSLVGTHMRLAAQLQRPISIHCVRSTGAMQDLLQSLADSDQLPPRIMMHSFGGPAESIKQLLSMRRNGLASRLWFSFSSVINSKRNRTKLIDCIRAVPHDRLLIESDQDSVLRMEAGLQAILEDVAEAYGWSLNQASEVAVRNFDVFYDGFLPDGYKSSSSSSSSPPPTTTSA